MEPLESNPTPTLIQCKDCLTPVEFSEAWYCSYCETVGLCPTCGSRHDHDCKPSTKAANQLEDDMSAKTFKTTPKVPKALIERRRVAINKKHQERATVIIGKVASCLVMRIPHWVAEKLAMGAGDVMKVAVLGKQLHVAHTAKEADRKKIRAQRAKELEERRAGKGKKKVTKAKKETPKVKKRAVKKMVKKAIKKAISKPKPTTAKVTKPAPKKKAAQKAPKPKPVAEVVEENIYTPPTEALPAE
jgi:antitoxin component of MazEF toxin-antitoxin module